jgi:hypothetical protein
MTYTSQYPPAYNSTYVKATTFYDANWYPHNAANPSTSLSGSGVNNSWATASITNQRFHIDLGSAFTIKRICFENMHDSAAGYNFGVKNFTFWGSNSATAFATLTYATDTDWTQLTCDRSTWNQHADNGGTADPQYSLVTNTTAYRYYAMKEADNWGGAFNGFRRIELQTEDAASGQFLSPNKGFL